MKLDRVTAKPGSTIILSYIFKDDVGQPISSDTPVTVSLYTRAGDILEVGLETTGGPKYSTEYTVPRDRPVDSYLVEFIGSYKSTELTGYLELQVVLATDADFAELSERTESSVTYDGTSVAYDSAANRLKALQALRPPEVGYITKKRRRSGTSCDDTRDYERYKGMVLRNDH